MPVEFHPGTSNFVPHPMAASVHEYRTASGTPKRDRAARTRAGVAGRWYTMTITSEIRKPTASTRTPRRANRYHGEPSDGCMAIGGILSHTQPSAECHSSWPSMRPGSSVNRPAITQPPARPQG